MADSWKSAQSHSLKLFSVDLTTDEEFHGSPIEYATKFKTKTDRIRKKHFYVKNEALLDEPICRKHLKNTSVFVKMKNRCIP